jgi:hypothetical protein
MEDHMTTLVAGGAVRIETASAGGIAQRAIVELRGALAWFLAAVAEGRRRRQALDTLDRIDARTLRDVGIDRGAVTLTD